MIDPSLKDFIVAIVGASASFIGLLFVAISFVMNDDKDSKVQIVTKRILAESSYAALLNIFFVGLVALIPTTNISYVIIAMSITGLANIAHYFKVVQKLSTDWAVLSLSTFVYIVELCFGIYVLHHRHGYVINNYAVMTLIIFLFSLALARAWELTGIQKD